MRHGLLSAFILFLLISIIPDLYAQSDDELYQPRSYSYFALLGGIEPEGLNSVNPNFLVPTVGIQYIQLDADRRKGTFIKLAYSKLSGEKTKTYSIRDTVSNSLCTYCTRDTLTRLDADLTTVQLLYGWIRPLKTLGDAHRLSWTVTLGYRYDDNRIDYLDDVSGWESETFMSHQIQNDLGLQYRWLASENLIVGIDWSVLQSKLGFEKSYYDDSGDKNISGYNLDQKLFSKSLSFWIGYSF